MSDNAPAKPSAIITMKTVLTRVPLSRSTIYARMADGTFPQSLDLGGGRIGWLESEIDEWIASLPRKT